MVFVFLDRYDVNACAEKIVVLQHLASFGQQSSHYLHLQYGVLKLSDNTSSSQTWCTAVNEIKKYKTSHTVQDILTSIHLARNLYQTYEKKARRNTLLRSSCDSWPFDWHVPSWIIPYRGISRRNVSHSQHFSVWNKISSIRISNTFGEKLGVFPASERAFLGSAFKDSTGCRESWWVGQVSRGHE